MGGWVTAAGSELADALFLAELTVLVVIGDALRESPAACGGAGRPFGCLDNATVLAYRHLDRIDAASCG